MSLALLLQIFVLLNFPLFLFISAYHQSEDILLLLYLLQLRILSINSMNVFDHIFSRLVMVSVCCGISNFVLFSANSKWSSVTYHSTLRKYFKNLINLITGCDLINITFGCMHFFAMAARKSPVQNYKNQSSDSQGRTLFRTF